jgi:hypothetical protein
MTAQGCSSFFVACDGHGNCKGDHGNSCQQDSDCLEDACGAGICCIFAETCVECLAGDGNFSGNTPAGQQGVNCRSAGDACDGFGHCKLAPGQPCTAGTDCASGVCNPVDGGTALCG